MFVNTNLKGFSSICDFLNVGEAKGTGMEHVNASAPKTNIFNQSMGHPQLELSLFHCLVCCQQSVHGVHHAKSKTVIYVVFVQVQIERTQLHQSRPQRAACLKRDEMHIVVIVHVLLG